MPDYKKEQIKELYESLPEDLKKALFAEESSQNISQVCAKNNITSYDEIFQIAKNIGYVLCGLLSPNELQEVLKKELNMEENTARKIASGIKNRIFIPVKESLEALYSIKLFQDPEEPEKEIETKAETDLPASKIERKIKKDSYREKAE